MFSLSAVAADVSMAVLSAQTAAGQKVLTFIAKNPPGQRRDFDALKATIKSGGK